MLPTLVTTALGRRGGHALAVTLAATAGVSGALADRAQAAPPPKCALMACPDLFIAYAYGGGNTHPGHALVQNVGGFRARLSTKLSVLRPGGNMYLTVPPLDPGQRHRVGLPLCVIPPGGNDDQTWTLRADHNNWVEESSETNNGRILDFECE
jgi:hypothetical protein